MEWREDESISCETSNDRTHRYMLTCSWDSKKPAVTFVMFNPTLEDENEADQTLRRCVSFARDWGYGSMIIVNLFSQVTPDPSEIEPQTLEEKITNMKAIRKAVMQSEKVVFAWGEKGSKNNKVVEEVLALVEDEKRFCIKRSKTKAKFPLHPLSQKHSEAAIPYEV
ncbi:hypothetical protein JNUCC1_00787 [Lentibacillus sp. JNUCC-1]|uniref:DUF1643 domain-containing protein n=1 Tax=Lentibacillus sp. JNUCC-1 TaxID=2654513 RepID=UPI0012E841C6|nr:DUF1643 domain-containing protein [Lentibacillus sp. JNUCC-1]MUV36981.1 hypothetical protein [Lentibacillus sp. JNUCC-1]